MGGQRLASAALLPEKTRYPLYRRLDGPQGRSGRVQKISPPLEFDPRTVRPIASHYIDWAIPAHICIYVYIYADNITVLYDQWRNLIVSSSLQTLANLLPELIAVI